MQVTGRFGGFQGTAKLVNQIGRSKITRALRLLGLMLAACIPANVHAQVTVSTNWRDYAVLGLNSVTYSDDTTITGGDVYAGRDMSAVWGLTVNGNAYTGGNLKATFFESITGNAAANG